MTEQRQDRVVVITDCYDCPHHDRSSCSANNVKCRLTKKRISGLGCTPFPKTCLLPRPAPASNDALELIETIKKYAPTHVRKDGFESYQVPVEWLKEQEDKLRTKEAKPR